MPYYKNDVSLQATSPGTADTGNSNISGISRAASIITGKIYPATDSTTALQILKADGTTGVVTLDTTNSRLGINVTPTATLDLLNTDSTALINGVWKGDSANSKWGYIFQNSGAAAFTGDGAVVKIKAVNATDTGKALFVESSGTNPASCVAHIKHSGAGTGANLLLENQGTGTALSITQGSTGYGATIAGLVGIGNVAPGAQLHVTSAAAGTIGQIIKGASAQTADLLQIQNSAGSILTKITSTGNLLLPDGTGVAPSMSFASDHSTGFYKYGANAFGVSAAGELVATFRNDSGQKRTVLYGNTYNGTVANSVLALSTDSTILATHSVDQTNKKYLIQPYESGVGYDVPTILNSLGGNVGIGTTAPGAKLQISTTAAAIGQIIRGAASQSANLQEWQNSSGTVLSYIDSTGKYTGDVSGIASGTYTPTRSAEVNMDGNVTTTEAQYMRVGSTVTVSGRFTADPTLTATATSFEITLPIASNIGAAEDVAGVAFCGNIASMGAAITGSAANDTAVISWVSTDITSQTWSYTFSYQIL